MKKILIILLLPLFSFGSSRYVSNSGNDASDGLTTATAWQTLARVQTGFAAMVSGDSVLLACNSSFYGSLTLTKSGIKFGYYGTGAKPIVTGLTEVAGWSLVSTGLYKASLNAANDLRYVTIDGAPTEWGRTPNKGLGTASYNYIESATTGSPRSFTDAQLTASPNRVGNHFVVKGQTWALGEGVVITQAGTTCTYRVGRVNPLGSGSYFQPAKLGSGYIWVGNLVDVDQYGEWHYDTTANELYMFFGAVNPNTKTIKAATTDILFDLVGFNSISIEGIELNGANRCHVFEKNGSGTIKVKNCTLDGSASRGILISNSSNITVENNTFLNIFSIPVRLPVQFFGGSSLTNASVQRNTIGATNAPFETMFYNAEDYDGDAIVCGMTDNTIANNTILATAYMGVWYNGSNVLIQNNNITGWGKWSNDCGAVYSIGLAGRGTFATYTNRYITNNYIHDATAWVYGLNNNTQTAANKGVYFDDQVMNVICQNNYICFVDIGISNNLTDNVWNLNNLIIGSRGINFNRKRYSQFTNFQFRKNVISPPITTNHIYFYGNDSISTTTIFDALAGYGTIDSNYTTQAYFGTEIYSNAPAGYKRTNYDLAQWKTITGKSATDVQFPFLPFSETGRKLVENWTGSSAVTSLSGIYKDYLGNIYTNSITLPAYTVRLLYYSEAVPPVPQGTPLRVPFIIKN